jgi:hypothetical protein
MPADEEQRWLLAFQTALWMTTGLSLLILSIKDFLATKNADSFLLFL